MKLTKNPTTGRIYARLKTGNPAKPYVRMTLGTKNAAEAKKKAAGANLAKIESAMQGGNLSLQAIARLTTGKKLSTGQAFAQFVAAGENRGDAPSTIAKNAAVGAQWFAFAPAVKSLPPLALTAEHIAPFINRPNEDAGAKTRERQLSVIRQFLRYCADLGVSQGNPANLVSVDHRRLTHAQREPKAVQPFTAAEVARLLATAEGWWRWATGISNATGMRLGDICTLEHDCLTVPGFIVVWTDKRDRRVCLPINREVTPGLAGILAEIPPGESRYLFPEQAALYASVEKGRPLLSMQFKRLLDSLDLKGRSFHSLRHTAITRWDKQGFDLDQCATYAGHGNSRTTKGYIHA